jgi:FMN phosphatase YigB (HAD superfamily)
MRSTEPRSTDAGTVGAASYHARMVLATDPRPRICLLVTDLDNTLWDWFAAWHASFVAMLDKLAELSGIPDEILREEMRAVHRRRGTTEYSYLLNELPSLQRVAGGAEPLKVFDGAIHRLNSERVRNTKLYPKVAETLRHIKSKGVPIVAYSESLAYWTEWRIRRTGLDGVIDVLYTSPDHEFPTGVSAAHIRTRPASSYGLRGTDHKYVSRGIIKPAPEILGGIVRDFGLPSSSVAYVGDSPMKDVAMAQAVGVRDVLASYGMVVNRAQYELLREVSHWSDDDIERERALAARPSLEPSYRLNEGFDELLELFDFATSV